MALIWRGVTGASGAFLLYSDPGGGRYSAGTILPVLSPAIDIGSFTNLPVLSPAIAIGSFTKVGGMAGGVRVPPPKNPLHDGVVRSVSAGGAARGVGSGAAAVGAVGAVAEGAGLATGGVAG